MSPLQVHKYHPDDLELEYHRINIRCDTARKTRVDFIAKDIDTGSTAVVRIDAHNRVVLVLEDLNGEIHECPDTYKKLAGVSKRDSLCLLIECAESFIGGT